MNKTTKVAAVLTGALIFSQFGMIHSSKVDAATTTNKKKRRYQRQI
ncbi:hypothetical protein HMSSN139_54620 [Paenibacillus sp. HMSSN-139]|nr:hypothetical protein HMSSN139_54620 [Paenibacillus sp. HMSSN-139]